MEKEKRERRYKNLVLDPTDLIRLVNEAKKGDKIQFPILSLPPDVQCVACFCDQMSQGIVFLLYHASWPIISLNETPARCNLDMIWESLTIVR